MKNTRKKIQLENLERPESKGAESHQDMQGRTVQDVGFPIAIVSVAFRLPGDHCDEEELWAALKEEKDLISKIPDARWATQELQHDKRAEPGRSVTFSAGILSRIDEFDAGFFGISSREASGLDPQQRLLLELSWEAMENAGIPPSSMAGSDCAVYVGISGLDYGTRSLDDLASITPHFMTGNTLSLAANRISYVFDFHGPSLSVDTACSSSLVALHHACESLRSGDASAAMVGGVNMLLHPYPFVGFTKASMLSADGRCKVFDESANGYVRSEGGAVVLLKPLHKAIEDGNEIKAVIRASGVNADGARKTGITIPSAEGQVELMERVLGKSGLSALDIDYVEAHGTGTAIGDPIETNAIGAVYGQKGYRAQRLPIGSVKANLGHLEPASGMAGLVKALLVLKNHALPPAKHIDNPNSRIDFSALNLELVTAYQHLQKEKNTPLVIGLNSFGFGGANAHILLQEFQPRTEEQSSTDIQHMPPFFLSARSEASLRVMAQNYAKMLETGGETEDISNPNENDIVHTAHPPYTAYDLAYAVAHQRDFLKKRLVYSADSQADLIDSLRQYANGESETGFVREDSLQGGDNIAFVYSGNGAQWVGMGQQLLADVPRFAEIIEHIEAMIAPLTGFSITEELHRDASTSRLDDTVVAQPLLFAIQVACTLLLEDYGVKPMAVTGHSVGEVAAAWAAGALDLEQAVQLIVARSEDQGKTRGTGRMAAVGLSADAMEEILADLGEELDINIAGFNSPNNITLSGKLEDLEHVQKHLEPKNIFFRLLDLDYAFHSRQMDPIKACLQEHLAHLRPSQADKARFVSTVSGKVLCGTALDAQYWWRNVREPVRFADAIEELIELGCRTCIEIGPHAILQRYILEGFAAANVQTRVLPLLKRDADGPERIRETALRAHLLAPQPAIQHFFPTKGQRVRLPNYPWQRERHWHPETSEGLHSFARRRVHPLLGWRLYDAEAAWENTIDTTVLPWLVDHKIGGAVVFPGSAYVEMALAAAREFHGGEHLIVEDLDIVSPMVFGHENARIVRLVLHPRDGSFQIQSRQRLSEDDWAPHAAGRVLKASRTEPYAYMPCTKPLCSTEQEETDRLNKIEKQTHYSLTERLGLNYGPTFQGLNEAKVIKDRLDALVDFPEELADDGGYFLHPAIMDVCNQSLVDFFQDDIEAGHGVAFLPIKLGRLDLYSQEQVGSFQAHLTRRGRRSVVADFVLYDREGALIASVSDARFRVAPIKSQEKGKVASWSLLPRLQPHPHDERDTSLPPSAQLKEHCCQALRSLYAERQKWFKEYLPLMEELVLSFTYESFKLFEEQGKGNIHTLLAGNADLPPLTSWLADILVQRGLLEREDGQWCLVDETVEEIPPAEDIWYTLLDDAPVLLPQLSLIGQIGRNLPDLLVNASLGEELFSTLQRSPSTEALYHDDPVYRGIRLAIASILQDLASSWPQNRRLRILEIAAGPSAFPRVLLDLLPQDRLDYVLALPNDTHLQRQEVEYQDVPHLTVVSCQHEDLQRIHDAPLAEQYDVVVLSHVLHTSRAPQAVLQQVRQTLAWGGTLLLAERYPDWSANILGGLTRDWWHEPEQERESSGDKLVPSSSLVQPEAWLQALSEEGYDDLEVFSEEAAGEQEGGAYLLMGKRPAAPPGVLRAEVEEKRWIFLADSASLTLAEILRSRLEGQGQQVVIKERIDKEDSLALDHLVHLQGWGDSSEDAGSLLVEALHTVQLLTSCQPPPRLWLVTQGGALVSDPPAQSLANPGQAALWGFGRVVMNEFPHLDCTLIDIACPDDDPELPTLLENDLLWPNGAKEILLGSAGRFTPVMAEDKSRASEACTEESRYRLDFHLPGKLRNLLWLSEKERALQDNEIEVRTEVTGLNFRDIMYVMGILPDEAVEKGFAGASLGLEFSGVVSRTGEAVSDICPGDRVMGFGSSCFASHVVTDANAVVPIPDDWSFEEAATVPTVYFSAYYSLCHLADVQPGERVLIHGAAGGVGIAAIRLARYLGAEIFATAGNDEKRAFVRLLGADHVFDSRSLSFADDILAITKGEGVDVILNSLAGEAIRRNLQVLKPFGRFLELGKRDFFENTPVGLRFFKDNISYYGIDVDQLFIARPQLAARLFRELMVLFEKKEVTPLPFRVFTTERIVDAFYEMMEARHIGKVLITFRESKAQVHVADSTPPAVQFDTDSTWLVTGGIEGFGRESALWLAQRGVGNLALVSRRGMASPGASNLLADLTEKGVNVEILSCDVTKGDTLAATIAHIRATMPPLQGILHAAMVLDDRFIANTDQQSMEAVLAPKLTGAWNLHALTKDDTSLEYFVMYSSITTTFGNPGQANYVSANAAMEGLAQLRQQMGLPVTCIGWGPIGDTGYLTRNTAVRDSLSQRFGKPPLSIAEALEQLDSILGQKKVVSFWANFDWRPLSRLLPSSGDDRFALLNSKLGDEVVGEEITDFRALIRTKSKEELSLLIRNLIAQEISQILLIKTERIDPHGSLHDMGLDSLMAVELAQGLEQRFGIQLPVMMLNESPSIEGLTVYIFETLSDDKNEEQDSQDETLMQELAMQHGEEILSSDIPDSTDSIDSSS